VRFRGRWAWFIKAVTHEIADKQDGGVVLKFSFEVQQNPEVWMIEIM